jgi:Mce-associated membrane protein
LRVTSDSAATAAPESERPADASGDDAAASKRRQRRERAAERVSAAAQDGADDAPRRGGPTFPLVPALSVVLVLLLAGAGFLWFTRPATSSIRTADYVGALEAARSGVVDLTSFDYLTLDDDIRQVQRLATGSLVKETTDRLNQSRKSLTDAQAVVSTKIIGAGVTRADPDSATVVQVIETTQKSKAGPQAQVLRFRIEVQMKKVDGRWLLSGITGR